MELTDLSDAEFRAEALRRGYVLHSKQFSEAAQAVIRDADKLRGELERLVARAEGLRVSP